MPNLLELQVDCRGIQDVCVSRKEEVAGEDLYGCLFGQQGLVMSGNERATKYL